MNFPPPRQNIKPTKLERTQHSQQLIVARRTEKFIIIDPKTSDHHDR
jgi:hypothetical protein